MLGDVLLIEEKHHLVGAQIVEEILKRKKDRFIVAVSGESGTGKSELAHVVAKGLSEHGIVAKPIHIDNYYKVLPKERMEYRLKNGIDNVVGYDEYDWSLINKNILDFKNKAQTTMPCVDLVTEQVDMLTTNMAEVDMLIIDGLYSINTEDIDLRIFIDINYHNTIKSQNLRGKETMNEYRMKVILKEHEMVRKLKDKASIIITKEYQLEIVS